MVFSGKKAPGPRSGTPGGMLTGQAIRDFGIIERASETSFRHASYDLVIGKLIDPTGKIVEDYVLEPRGIVEVISRERVRIPEDLIGIAMVKTSLCNDGILALGIGIIDPGWEGPISSYLINFSKSPRLLRCGEVFLRTTFQRLDGPLPRVERISKSDDEITNSRRNATVSKIGGSFLNLGEELEKLSRDRENERWLKTIGYVSAIALIITFTGFLMTWFSSGLAGKPPTSSMVVSQPLANEIDILRAENSDLKQRLTGIEGRIRAVIREGRPGALPNGDIVSNESIVR